MCGLRVPCVEVVGWGSLGLEQGVGGVHLGPGLVGDVGDRGEDDVAWEDGLDGDGAVCGQDLMVVLATEEDVW